MKNASILAVVFGLIFSPAAFAQIIENVKKETTVKTVTVKDTDVQTTIEKDVEEEVSVVKVEGTDKVNQTSEEQVVKDVKTKSVDVVDEGVNVENQLKLEKGKKYAWVVIAGDLRSEPGVITKAVQTITPATSRDQATSKQDRNQIILKSPVNGEVIGSDSYTFKWETGSTGPYKIKIVEIIGDQSPEEAILRNKPIFESNEIWQQTFQYPSSSPRLEKEKKTEYERIDGQQRGVPIQTQKDSTSLKKYQKDGGK